MGSNTYNADPIKPSSNHFFVGMTGHPSDYKGMETSGKLEFTNDQPCQNATNDATSYL